MKPTDEEKDKMLKRLQETDNKSGASVHEIKELREKVCSLMLTIRGEQEKSQKLYNAAKRSYEISRPQGLDYIILGEAIQAYENKK